MPWRAVPGNTQFSGRAAEWVETLVAWGRQDWPELDASTYVSMIVLAVAIPARDHWSKDLFGKRKVSKLDSFYEDRRADGSSSSVHIWDLLDYLAEEVDGGLLTRWAAEARQRMEDDIRRGAGGSRVEPSSR